MAAPLTVDRAVNMCRERVADTSASVWDDESVVTVLDNTLEDIWTRIRLQGPDLLTERIDVPSSDFASDGFLVYSWSPIGAIGPIRKIEVLGSSGRPLQVVKTELEIKDFIHPNTPGSGMLWHRSHGGKLSIAGNLQRYQTVRIWFVRRFPPMHFGQTSGVGTTSTMVLAASPNLTGRVVRRDIYDGTEVEFTSGAIKDQIVRITDFDTSTLTATFTPNVASPVGASQGYAMVVPVAPEHGEYVVEEMSARLLERSGNANYIAAKDGRLARLREAFMRDVIHRDQDAPLTIYNYR